MTSHDIQICIMRSTLSNRLFDVVQVDYVTEDVSFLAKAQTFKDAQEIVLQYEDLQNAADELEEMEEV